VPQGPQIVAQGEEEATEAKEEEDAPDPLDTYEVYEEELADHEEGDERPGQRLRLLRPSLHHALLSAARSHPRGSLCLLPSWCRKYRTGTFYLIRAKATKNMAAARTEAAK
jgi:hypothetical protein